MIFPPSILYHRREDHAGADRLGPELGVLSWNVHKISANRHLRPILHELIRSCDLQLILLQEAAIPSQRSSFLPSGWSYDAAANLSIAGKHYGVLSAASARSLEGSAYLSAQREPLGTYKSLLLTRYALHDTQPLLLLNIHAVNFRGARILHRELSRVFSILAEHRGPMIVGGDFNTWSSRRRERLDAFGRMLNLQAVSFDGPVHPTRFFGQDLDHILYRGLKLLESRVLSVPYSDHRPLCARFGLIGTGKKQIDEGRSAGGEFAERVQIKR